MLVVFEAAGAAAVLVSVKTLPFIMDLKCKIKFCSSSGFSNKDLSFLYALSKSIVSMVLS